MPHPCAREALARRDGARVGMAVTRLIEDPAAPDGGALAGLIRRIAVDRDRQAYARIYGFYAPRVNAFLRKSGLSPADAEEVTQEAMLNVWRKAASFDPARAGVSTWIFTIARNLKIDHLRRRKVAAHAETATFEEEGEELVSAEAMMIAAQREEQVRTALRGLSDEQAAVVRLSFLSDKAHSEIARELGLPLGTVKSRVRLALGRLRMLLDAP